MTSDGCWMSNDLRTRVRNFCAFACALAVIATASASAAQDLSSRFGGFAADQDAPINIEANRLEVNDVKKTATFIGKVVAKQGEFTMRSRTLTVYYTGDAASGGGARGNNQDIKRILAKGGVVVTNGKNSSARGDQADFDVAAQIIRLSGNVALDQCGNVLKGSAMTINLVSGQSKLENTNTGGRVSAVFQKRPDNAKTVVKKKSKKKKKQKAAREGC